MDWQDVNIEIPRNASGNVKAKCPECVHTHSRGKQNAKDLSVNIEEGVWNCHRCGWSGKLREERKEYFVPQEITLPISERATDWFSNRGISKNTLLRFKISSKREWMPQTGKEETCIVFPYFRNERIVNNKYRDGHKNFKMEKGAELILFNLDAIDGAKEIIITEGEIDALSVYEAGKFNVCSVPNGASNSSNSKMEYLDNCWKAFRNAEKIVIATDADEPGIALKNELSRRFGKYRCLQVEYPEGCKDLNEVLVKHGKDVVKSVLENAVPFPIEGVFSMEDLEPEIDHFRENGYPKGRTVGLNGFDYDHQNDTGLISFLPGQVTTVTGTPGSGKSTFIDNLMVKIAAREGDKIGVCSFETQPSSIHSINLQECFIGKKVVKIYGGKMTEPEYNLSKSFVGKHFYFFKMRDADTTIEGILGRAKELVMRYGITFLIIDPYNKIEHKVPKGMNKTDYVALVFNSIKRFAEDYGVHVFFVAHPTKMKKNEATGEFEVPNLYSIADSAHFYNMTDNGITVHRERSTGAVFVYVQKVRFSFLGKEGMIQLQFDPITKKRYAPVDEGFEIEARYYLKRIEADQAEFDFSTEQARLPLSREFQDNTEELPF